MAPGTSTPIGRPQVDICFVFDTTGSMSDKIDGLVKCMSQLVSDLDALGLDWRITTVPFGDLTVPGDRIEDRMTFVSDISGAHAQLRSMPRFSGGGNEGESSIEAMLVGLKRPWRHRALPIVVLLTDEPALISQRARPEMVAEALRAAEVVCFVASPRCPYFLSWARDNGGRWVPIGPSMDTSALLRLLRGLVGDMATVAHEVHELAQGSVRRYLELTGGTSGSLPT